MEDYTKQDEAYRAYKKGFEAGVKSVTDNNVGGKMTPTDKDINVLTNADRIRAMSDEELAERLIFWNDDWGRWETDAGNFGGDPNDTKETAIKAELEWLKQLAEVDNG